MTKRYWNRYPGAQCDIESYIYMPLVEELGVIPTEKYSRGPELFRHARAIGDKYGLRDRTHFWTTVNEFRWLESESVWQVVTDRKDNIKARWFIAAPGPLQDPKFPGVPGIGTFRGKSFHTARWDYSYSGGEPESRELKGLADKRVAIIGTGATGIQVVPQVGRWAKELHVFQRTPSSVDIRANRPTDDNWATDLAKGWQRRRQENFTTIISGAQTDEDLVNDGWTYILRALGGFTGNVGGLDPATIAARLQLADYQQMERVRKRVDDVVGDAATAEGLKPYYNQWCKRPCFHDEYLDTFNRPNVKLVHTDGKGIERITETGIVANGKHIELDCIIYATGFEWNNLDFTKSQSSLQIIGRNGLRLVDKWHQGAITFQGWSGHDFPNSMIISPLQGGGNPNYTHNSGELVRHFLYLMDECKKRNIRVMEPTPEAEQAWVKECMDTQGARGEFLKDCIPGYYNDEGYVSDATLRNQPYGGGPWEYLSLLRRWREAGDLEGLALQYGSVEASSA